MLKKLTTILAVVLVLGLAVLFGTVLLSYVPPMEDVSLNLSLIPTEDIWEAPEEYDEKGWTVFTQEGDRQTILIPNGLGGYTGLELGQTFYFSRVMIEDLDSPTLQLGAANRNFSVWLDENLIYTDCPELDNRVGYLRLPMRDYDREEPITISLPADYHGKTLTIAQSFPPYTEIGSVRACPAETWLYCGYAYESELISESFSVAMVAALAYLVGAVLLVAFLRHRDWRLVCLAVVVFLWMSIQLIDTSFFWQYFGTFDNSPLFFALESVLWGILLIYLASRGGTYRSVLWGILVVYGVSLAISVGLNWTYPYFTPQQQIASFLAYQLPDWLGFGGLAALLVLAVGFWRKEIRFYRIFWPLALMGIAVSWLVVRIFIHGSATGTFLLTGFRSGSITYLLSRSTPPIIIVTLLIAIVEVIQAEIQHHTDKRLLEEYQALAMESYAHMRRQHEEVMILRHDMNRHFTALQRLSGEDKVRVYLDELIGQAQAIRPVVQSGNTMLDILLNSKLGIAADKGIAVEIIRAEAPETLPLSDKDLCSLVLNILDNAIAAAADSGAPKPFIRLDIHARGNFLVFLCENACQPEPRDAPEMEKTVPKHGFGLKIISSVVSKYNGVVNTESRGNHYHIQVVIHLC